MTKPKQRFTQLDRDTRVSILEYSDSEYEIAVQWRPYPYGEPQRWEIDYSVYPDVIKADNSMDVYGIIREIRAEYGI